MTRRCTAVTSVFILLYISLLWNIMLSTNNMPSFLHSCCTSNSTRQCSMWIQHWHDDVATLSRICDETVKWELLYRTTYWLGESRSCNLYFLVKESWAMLTLHSYNTYATVPGIGTNLERSKYCPAADSVVLHVLDITHTVQYVPEHHRLGHRIHDAQLYCIYVAGYTYDLQIIIYMHNVLSSSIPGWHDALSIYAV